MAQSSCQELLDKFNCKIDMLCHGHWPTVPLPVNLKCLCLPYSGLPRLRQEKERLEHRVTTIGQKRQETDKRLTRD